MSEQIRTSGVRQRYRYFSINPRTTSTSIAWKLAKGGIRQGLQALHKCDASTAGVTVDIGAVIEVTDGGTATLAP